MIIPAVLEIYAAVGSIPSSALSFTAEVLEITLDDIESVIKFSPNNGPNSENPILIQVCSNEMCMQSGGSEIIASIRDRIGIDPGETTLDHSISLRTVECLDRCETMPGVEMYIGDING